MNRLNNFVKAFFATVVFASLFLACKDDEVKPTTARIHGIITIENAAVWDTWKDSGEVQLTIFPEFSLNPPAGSTVLGSQEAIAARDVVDAVKLLDKRRAGGNWLQGLGPAPSAADGGAIDAVVSGVDRVPRTDPMGRLPLAANVTLRPTALARVFAIAAVLSIAISWSILFFYVALTRTRAGIDSGKAGE